MHPNNVCETLNPDSFIFCSLSFSHSFPHLFILPHIMLPHTAANHSVDNMVQCTKISGCVKDSRYRELRHHARYR